MWNVISRKIWVVEKLLTFHTVNLPHYWFCIEATLLFTSEVVITIVLYIAGPCHKFCRRCCRSCLVFFFFLNAQEVSIDEETLFHQFIVLYLDLHSVKIWRIFLPPKNFIRKIIFKWFRLLKTTILTVTNVLTFDFAEFLCLFKVEIYQNYNSVFINIPTSITIVSEILTSSKLISRKIRGIEKF